ncbi:hypothetical protein AWC22_09680 [Mycobacterium riyadhense]|uniref:Uncharacterized protein n=1 Tax=Mycobacterium riyadhense TaxID=486698 RepID=A0A1X2DHP1_9MYCO|nr:hypothetical protein AWC22_09680 [Mycobacterium riyadhense]
MPATLHRARYPATKMTTATAFPATSGGDLPRGLGRDHPIVAKRSAPGFGSSRWLGSYLTVRA